MNAAQSTKLSTRSIYIASEQGVAPFTMALNWHIERPEVTLVSIDARNEEQLRDYRSAALWKLREA